MLKLGYEEFVGKIHLSMRGHCNKQGKFDWASAVLDAAIISGITFFTGLGTLASSCVMLRSIILLFWQRQNRKSIHNSIF